MVFQDSRQSASIVSTAPSSYVLREQRCAAFGHPPEFSFPMHGWFRRRDLYVGGSWLHAAFVSTENIFQKPKRVRSTYCSLSSRDLIMLHVILFFHFCNYNVFLGRYLEDRFCVACTRLLLRSKLFSGIMAFIG